MIDLFGSLMRWSQGALDHETIMRLPARTFRCYLQAVRRDAYRQEQARIQAKREADGMAEFDRSYAALKATIPRGDR